VKLQTVLPLQVAVRTEEEGYGAPNLQALVGEKRKVDDVPEEVADVEHEEDKQEAEEAEGEDDVQGSSAIEAIAMDLQPPPDQVSLHMGLCSADWEFLCRWLACSPDWWVLCDLARGLLFLGCPMLGLGSGSCSGSGRLGG